MNKAGDNFIVWAWDAGTEEKAYAKYLTGGVDSSFPAINGFDGSESTFTRVNQNQTMTFEPASDIAFTKIEIYANNDNSGNGFTNTWKVNGTDVTSTVNSAAQTSFAWVDVTSSVSSPLDKLEVISGPSGGSNPRFGGIRINDTVLVANGNGTVAATAQYVNNTSGFSITTWEGNDTASYTVGHGLNVKPDFMWVIRYTANNSVRVVYNSHLTAHKYNYLTLDNATEDNAGFMNDTEPTNNVFTLGSFGEWDAGESCIAYSWAAIPGYSSFGTYSGGLDPTFIYTGFRPKFVMLKCTSTTDSWLIYDSVRNKYNVVDDFLQANTSEVEATGNANKIDILSNGFAIRGAQNGTAGSGKDYQWASWADQPFKTARAR